MLAPRAILSLSKDHLADAVALVLPQVVQPADLAWLARRGQHVLDVHFEAAGGHRLVQDQPGSHPLQSTRGDGGAIRPVIRGRARIGALATRRPGVRPGQAGVTAELVNPDAAARVDRRGQLGPGPPGWLNAFAGPARLFFASSPDPE
jgi:hypothetical protein